MKYNTVYKTTYLPSGKFYIGRHITENPNDPYLGSGTYFKNLLKFDSNRQHYKKEVQVICELDEMFNIEKQLIEQNINDPLCMNLMIGDVIGGFVKHNEKTKKKMSKTRSGRKQNVEWILNRIKSNTGKKRTEEYKQRMSLQKKGISNTKLIGIPRSKEIREKISKANCHKLYEVTFPGGQTRIIKSITKFAKEHNLDSRIMYAVLHEKLKHHRGFKVKFLRIL